MQEKYIKLVQDMYRGAMQNSSTQCGRGEHRLWGGGRTTCSHMDVLTEDARKDVPGSMMFAAYIVGLLLW